MPTNFYSNKKINRLENEKFSKYKFYAFVKLEFRALINQDRHWEKSNRFLLKGNWHFDDCYGERGQKHIKSCSNKSPCLILFMGRGRQVWDAWVTGTDTVGPGWQLDGSLISGLWIRCGLDMGRAHVVWTYTGGLQSVGHPVDGLVETAEIGFGSRTNAPVGYSHEGLRAIRDNRSECSAVYLLCRTDSHDQRYTVCVEAEEMTWWW